MLSQLTFQKLHLQADKASLAQDTSQTFDWAHQWYPIGSAEDMDPSRPHAISILGQDLVLWCDQQGDWRAFDDLCPHRLAPLSGYRRLRPPRNRVAEPNASQGLRAANFLSACMQHG